jgi:hypothetical protein
MCVDRIATVTGNAAATRAGLLPGLAVAGMVLLAGCNRGPAMSQVSGKVFYKDGSVPRGGVCAVRFEPISAVEVRKGASGTIEPDGSFTMWTRKPGDGVYHGEYAVTFAVWKAVMDPTSLIQDKYTRSDTTPYKVTVDGDQHDLKFEIEPLPGAPRAAAAAGSPAGSSG